MTDEAKETEGDAYEFSISLQIKHPSIDPEEISRALNLVPFRSWKVGESRQTPKGTPLEGIQRESYWCFRWTIEGTRFFFEQLSKLIGLLEPHSEFIHMLCETGGSLILTINLFGDKNIGDVLSVSDLQRLVALHIQLSVEVF